MSNKIKMLIVIVVFAFTFWAMISIWFQSTKSNTVQAQSAPSKLTLELSANQANYLQLEPVVIFFKLSNSTNVPIT